MTVCIAALCDNSKSVLAITDRKISSDFGDTETDILKWRKVHSQWAVMFAASDATPIAGIVTNAERRMRDSDGSLEAAQSLIAAAYRDARLKKAEDLHLATRGWTFEEFKAKGRSLLPDPLFLQIDRSIREVNLGVSLLVMGTADGVCHIFTVEDPGLSEDRSIPGFHAIGSGSYNAIASLYHRQLRPAAYFSKALFCLYEAKKYAEKVGSVGEKTDIWVMRPDEKQRGWITTEPLEKELESLWNRVKPGDANLETLKPLQELFLKTQEEKKEGKC